VWGGGGGGGGGGVWGVVGGGWGGGERCAPPRLRPQRSFGNRLGNGRFCGGLEFPPGLLFMAGARVIKFAPKKRADLGPACSQSHVYVFHWRTSEDRPGPHLSIAAIAAVALTNGRKPRGPHFGRPLPFLFWLTGQLFAHSSHFLAQPLRFASTRRDGRISQRRAAAGIGRGRAAPEAGGGAQVGGSTFARRKLGWFAERSQLRPASDYGSCFASNAKWGLP